MLSENREQKFVCTRVAYKFANNGFVWVVAEDSETPNPLFVIAQSRVGGQNLGLYAARKLQKNYALGNYTGTIVSQTTAPKKTIKSVSDKLLEFEEVSLDSMSKNFFVIDGKNASAPYLSLINDPSRLNKNKKDAVSNVFNVGRFFYTSRAIPEFRFDKSLTENSKSELLWPYGVDVRSLLQ